MPSSPEPRETTPVLKIPGRPSLTLKRPLSIIYKARYAIQNCEYAEVISLAKALLRYRDDKTHEPVNFMIGICPSIYAYRSAIFGMSSKTNFLVTIQEGEKGFILRRRSFTLHSQKSQVQKYHG